LKWIWGLDPFYCLLRSLSFSLLWGSGSSFGCSFSCFAWVNNQNLGFLLMVHLTQIQRLISNSSHIWPHFNGN
jgi:hypothetical protein